MLSASQSFRLHEIVSRYFTKEDDAKNFVAEIEAVIERKYESEKDRIATKEDVRNLEVKIAESKVELLKWMFMLFTPFYIGMIVFLIKQFI